MPIRLRPRSRPRSLAQAAVLALVASPLAVLATAGPAHAAPVDIQILATNDFHGRLLPNGAEGGAAVLSGAVKQLKSENPNTVFTAAGDLIGASTFESFIADDEPTIDVLNEAGLEVSAAGNHEFDQGYDDLVGRVQDRANWEYIAANIIEPAGADELAESWVKDFGDVEVGFVGAVTEDLPSLVSPAGIAGVTVTDIVDATNAEATTLKAAGADVIVLLVHEGAPGTSLASATDPTNAFGAIVNGVSPDVDAIVSGHTHLAYNHSVPVPAWATEGRAVTERPVVSAGQYGSFLNQLIFTVDTATGDVAAKTQAILPMVGPDPDGSGPLPAPANYPADPATKTIVDAAVANAVELGAVELGDVAGPFNRARWSAPDGDDEGTERDIVENRGGESTLGNLVAEVQRWATEPAEFGGAEIAFMNPGGLRANMAGPTVTYRQAANVQPFANTLVNMDLTGAQIKTVLEQQWQRDAQGKIPSRPFLRLGTSEGFEYSYDPGAREGSKVTGIWLNGDPVTAAETFSVTVNSFLAAGGDNFRELANGANKRDTGQIDLQAMVDYMEEFASAEPLAVDSSQHSVGARVTPENITLTSLSMTGADDVKDTQVEVFEGATSLGTFPVTSDLATAPFDESGTATMPNPDDELPHTLRVVGTTTGTDAVVSVLAASAVSATAAPVTYGTDWTTEVTVAPTTATGTVEVFNGTTSLGTATLSGGSADVAIDGTALPGGAHTLTVRYLGDATHASSENTVEVQVAKAATTTTVAVEPAVAVSGQDQVTLTAAVSGSGFTPTGDVEFKLNGVTIGTATLSDGEATLTGGPINAVGTFAVTATFLGDISQETSTSEAAQLRVVKAASKVTVTKAPDKITTSTKKPRIKVTVTTAKGPASGAVKVIVGGKTYSATLNDTGKVTVRIAQFKTPGKKTVRVKYLGNATTQPDTAKLTFFVSR